MSADTANRYAHIDAMRALAVMLVVVAHAGFEKIVPGGSGVTIFFSISGFIITYLMLREKDAIGGFRIQAFYLRRALKIGPPLIVCVVVPTLVLAIFEPINWSPFKGVLFFYYNWYAVKGVYAPLPGSGVVWSLSIEEQFYLAFALIWVIIVRSGARTRWLTLIAASAVVWSTAARAVIASSADHTDRIYFGSDTRLDAIAWGILTAVAFHHSISTAGKIRSIVDMCTRDFGLIAAVLLYLGSLALRDEWFRSTFRFTIQALAACTVILYGFGSGRRSRLRTVFNAVSRVRMVQFIGLASYSIYLVHLIAISYLLPLTNELPRVVSIPLLLIEGTGSGMLVYLGVERSVQRMRNSQQARRRTSKLASSEDVDNSASAMR